MLFERNLGTYIPNKNTSLYVCRAVEKSICPTFKTEIINQSEADLDVSILFGRITRLYDQTSRKMSAGGACTGIKIPFWSMIY